MNISFHSIISPLNKVAFEVTTESENILSWWLNCGLGRREEMLIVRAIKHQTSQLCWCLPLKVAISLYWFYIILHLPTFCTLTYLSYSLIQQSACFKRQTISFFFTTWKTPFCLLSIVVLMKLGLSTLTRWSSNDWVPSRNCSSFKK